MLRKHKWITRLDNSINYSDLPSYYHFAKVCVSASWFETTGLTSLEALYCGANTVAAGPRAKEYLGSFASFCVPDNVESITEAIKKEYFEPRPVLDEKIRKEYTWQNAAEKTLSVYEDVLSSMKPEVGETINKKPKSSKKKK